MANSTGPQRVEAITRFGADFVVPGKIIHAVGGVCGAIQSQTKIVRSLDGFVSELKNEPILKVMQITAQTTKNLFGLI